MGQITSRGMRMAPFSGNCQKCGVWRRSLHRDHILPKWKGGADILENIQRLCANCHEEKTAEDMKGHPVSDKQKQEHSARMAGRKLTEEHRKKLVESHKGGDLRRRKWTPEQRLEHSARQRVAWTPERRVAHSLLAKEAWKNLPEEKRSKILLGLNTGTKEERIARATLGSLAAKAARDRRL